MKSYAWCFLGTLLATSLAPLAMPASAQPAGAIAVREGKPYRHKPSGLAIPATIDGLRRAQIRALADDALDVIVNFQGDSGDTISVYVYRLASGAVPV